MSTPQITAAVRLINGSKDKSTLNPKSEEVISELSSRQSRAESDVTPRFLFLQQVKVSFGLCSGSKKCDHLRQKSGHYKGPRRARPAQALNNENRIKSLLCYKINTHDTVVICP